MPPRSAPALCPARGGGAGPGPLPAHPPTPRRPSAPRPSPLPEPAPPGRPYCPCRKWEGRRRPLSSPPILGGEEASLLPSRKRDGRRASVFAGTRCAGTYSMGQPCWVSTQSSRRQGLWHWPGHRLRKTAGPGPGRRLARGVRILAPVRHRVEMGPGREASDGRRITWRCFRGVGRPRGSALAVADGSHAFVRVTVRGLTVPRGAPRLDTWWRRLSDRESESRRRGRGPARRGRRSRGLASERPCGGHPAGPALPPARPEARSPEARGDAPGRPKPPGPGRGRAPPDKAREGPSRGRAAGRARSRPGPLGGARRARPRRRRYVPG